MEQLFNRRINVTKVHTIQRFFEISPIHGCSYVGFRAAFYEAVFWSIMMAVCTGFLINDIITLTGKYRSESTSVSVVLERNQTINYADAAICFDVFRGYLAEAISSNFNEASFNASLGFLSAQLAASGRTDLANLSLTDPHIDFIVKTTYLLVANIVDYDLGTPGGGNPGYDNMTTRAVELVDAFFQQQGYGLGQLSEQTARYMCKQAQVSYMEQTEENANCAVEYQGSNYVCLDICDGAVTWVGFTMAFAPFDDLCFALNTPVATIFESPTDIIVFDTIYVTRMSRLLATWHEPPFTIPGYGTPHMTFDMRGWRGLMDPREMDSICLIGDTTGFLVGVQIDSQFVTYNHSWGTCGSIPLSDCALWNCLPAARMAADGCWPLAGYSLTAAMKPPKVPICNRTYTSDQVNYYYNLVTPNMGEWEMCILEKCTFPPCKAFEYLYATSLSSTAAHGANATLYQAKLSYAVFQEYITMDGNSFLASLGGSLALWLGASLISVIHIPIFAAAAFVSYLQRRGERKTSSVAFAKPATLYKSMGRVQPSALTPAVPLFVDASFFGESGFA